MHRALRVLLAGILGGIAMFAWASIAHMATPLDDLGISALPGGRDGEEAIRQALLQGMGEREGLYQIPSKATIDAAATPDARATLAEGPYGLLMYHPPGARAAGLEGVQIAGEFVIELIESLIVAALLACTVLTRYVARVAFVAGIGLAAVLTTNASYWVFYGFPGNYTLGYAFTDWVRYLCAGLVMAALLKPAVLRTEP